MKLTIFEIVKKLIGNTYAIGEIEKELENGS